MRVTHRVQSCGVGKYWTFRSMTSLRSSRIQQKAFCNSSIFRPSSLANSNTSAYHIPNPFLAKLQTGAVASTCLAKLVRTVEAPMIMKTAGFDSIFIDMEHGTLTIDTVSQLCLASLYAGITPLVRVPTKDPFFVSRVLDGGALGVVVPHIRNAQDARDVVNAAKYPPVGKRSATSGLPHFQFRPILANMASEAINRATMVIPMIETTEAVEDVDAIAAVPGVDSLMVGTNDLAAELGVPGQYEDPRIHEAYLKIIAACKKHKVFLGMGGLNMRPDLLEKYCLLGANWMIAGLDSMLLLSAATAAASNVKDIANVVAKQSSKGGRGRVQLGT